MSDPAPVSVNTPNVLDLQFIKVSVRTDFRFVKPDNSITFHWGKIATGGEPIKGATVELVGKNSGQVHDQALTDDQGLASLETSQLPDGNYTVRITPKNSRNELAGPRIAETDPDPLPLRMYHPLEVSVTLAQGKIDTALIDSSVKYASLGNRLHKEWPPATLPTDHLPIDLKPIWMRAPRRIGTKTRHTDAIQLFVIHNTGADSVPEAYIGPDINQFIVDSTLTIPPENPARGQIHYLMDFNGHVIKFMKDTEIAWHAGGKWHDHSSNDISLGMEVVHKEEKESPTQPDRDHVLEYTRDQYSSLVDFLTRLHDAYSFDHTQIAGHSDVGTTLAAPDLLSAGREQDPGQIFRWENLEGRGWGMIPSAPDVSLTGAYGSIFDLAPTIVLQENDNDGIAQPGNSATPRHGGPQPAPKHGFPAPPPTPIPPGTNATPIKELQDDLVTIGYSLLSPTVRTQRNKVGVYDRFTKLAVWAFQRHFFSGDRRRAKDVEKATTGKVDKVTAQMIKNVLAGLAPPSP
jgi:N-acetyl-anhydromuramyl-L-alanine amidase AmpD